MYTPRTFVLGQSLELHDGPYRLVAHQGGMFKLRNELTNHCALFTHVELHRLLPKGSSLEVATPTVKPLHDDLDGLTADDIALVPHLRELADGTPAVGDEPRSQYDPRLPMTQRRASKLLELDKLHMPITERTLQRRLSIYIKEGVAGLGDKRKGRTEERFARLDERVRQVLIEFLFSSKGRTATTYTAIRAELHVLLADVFPDRNDRPATPSISSIERYVRQLMGDQDPTKPGARRETIELRPKRAFRPRLVVAPGDECQIDTTTFDAMVRMPDGGVRRPHLTTLLDARTRSIIGFNFTDGPPTGEDHAHLIACTLVPHALRPWSAQYDELELPELPWVSYVDGASSTFDTHRPYIFPRRVLTDNAQDLRSVVLQATAERYGIHLTEAPPQDPTRKAKVERMFRTIKTMFAGYLPGYVGGNTQARGARAEREEPLELRTVIEMFDRWLALVWQNREHEGLDDPFEPGVQHTPNTMYAASMELTGHFMMPLGEDDYIALLPREKRTIQSDGIEFRLRKYDSPHLGPMRNLKDGDGKSLLIAVHYDKSDPSRVWVLSPFDGEWITCEWSEDRGLARPNERRMLAEAADIAKKTKKLKSQEAHILAVQIRNECAAAERKRVKEQKAADQAAHRKKAKKSDSRLRAAAIESAPAHRGSANDYRAAIDLGSL
jgi:putative transposase